MILISTKDLAAMLKNLLEETLSTLVMPSNQTNSVGSIETPITQSELAAHLHVTIQTIINLREKGTIPYYRAGGKPIYILSEVMDALQVNNKRLRKAA